jgi:hypothetical protein
MLLPPFALAVVTLSLALRVAHRGPYYPGWDVLGAVHGLYVASTRSVGEVAVYCFERYRAHDFVWCIEGVLGMLPGWLAARWPSEYWPHAITFSLTVLTLCLLARATALGRRDVWVVLLAWSASPSMLSWSVTGLPYVSNVLPYALALWVVLRWQSSWIASAAIALLTVEVSWQVQELGRTVFAVFVAAALFLPDVPWRTRLVWCLVAAWQGWQALASPTLNTARFVAMEVPSIAVAGPRLLALAGRLARLEILMPAVPVAAAAGLVFLGRRRWFWGALVGFHAALILLVAVNEGTLLGVDAVSPRRALLFLALCVATVCAAYRERRSARPILAGVLMLGAVWQLVDTVRWSREPFPTGDFGQGPTLPFVASSIDYTVPYFLVDWYAEMRDHADAGRKLILVYNLSSYDENPTDPAGILERLYLHLGHARFVDSVFVFGTRMRRWNELPIRPIDDLAGFVAAIDDPTAFDGYWLRHESDAEPWPAARRFRLASGAVLSALAQRFDIVHEAPVVDGPRTLIRFSLQ